VPFGEDHQVAHVANVSLLGVHGPTPLEAEMSSEGLDLFDEVCVHHLTLTNPRAIGKDIHPSARRVLALGRRSQGEVEVDSDLPVEVVGTGVHPNSLISATRVALARPTRQTRVNHH